MAVTNRRPGRGLIIHSDRGSQYASFDYQQLLREHGFICSMSRKGDCWDNSPMESFFKTLKTELVYHRHYKSRSEAKLETSNTSRFFTIVSGSIQPLVMRVLKNSRKTKRTR